MRNLKLLSIFLLGILIYSCNAQQPANENPKTEIQNVNPEAAKNLLEKNTDIIILDVRTPREFTNGHIKGAININIADKDFRTKIEELERDSTYMVYCAVGSRSNYAVNFMKELDFKTIYHLEHGITEWMSEGNPVEK